MFAASLVGYMSGEVAGRDVDHDDDDEKGQWNRSIASLRSELSMVKFPAGHETTVTRTESRKPHPLVSRGTRALNKWSGMNGI